SRASGAARVTSCARCASAAAWARRVSSRSRSVRAPVRTRMKLLLINPNISEDVTAIMAAEARRSASPGTEIATATARFGALYIENRVEASVASHAVLDALAEHGAGADAAIISAFGDPRLAAARDLVDV